MTPPTKNIPKPNRIMIPEVQNWLREHPTKGAAAFRVHGRSMRPFLDDGRDMVILVPPCAEKLHRGDVVLAEVAHEHYVLHRLIRREGDLITLKGDGNAVGTEQCHVKDVIGVATGFLRKGRTKPDSVTGWKWRTYSKIWMALSPIRRYLLAIHRRIFLRLSLPHPHKELSEATPTDTQRETPTETPIATPTTPSDTNHINAQIMRKKTGFILRDVCGEKVIIAEGLENLDFSKLINLNESAALIWNGLGEEDFSVEQAADILCREYEVDREQAIADAGQLLDEWREQGLIE